MIPQKTANFLTDDSLEYLDLSHLSITSNGLSTKKEIIANPLGVLPYQCEPGFDRDSPEKNINIGWGWGRG